MELARATTSTSISAALFILRSKWMNTPATARRGVIVGEIGMLLAVSGRCSSHEDQ